jgi:LmbE family N-acetylglucosaminyl deacetylase
MEGSPVSSVLLAPHGDDETLFAAFTCHRWRPHVIVCFYPAEGEERMRETAMATAVLGCPYTQWDIADPDHLASSIRNLALTEDLAYAPAVEEHGHEEHNLVGQTALDAFGEERMRWYLTYAPRGHRSHGGEEVQPSWLDIEVKLRALSCYRTQITDPLTRPWFYDLLDLREWVRV